MYRKMTSNVSVSWQEFDSWVRELADKLPEDKWIWPRSYEDMIAATLLARYTNNHMIHCEDDYMAEMKESKVVKFSLTNDVNCDAALIKYDYDSRLKSTPEYFVIEQPVDVEETNSGQETYRTHYNWPWNK